MNATSHSACATDAAPGLRVVLTPDHHVSTVALELVRAAAEYQTRVCRKEDTTGLVAEFSERFGIDARLSEALLAGTVKVEIEDGRLVVQSNVAESDADRTTARRGVRCAALPPSTLGPEERARRMHSVMLMHTAARGAGAQSVASLANVSEFLIDLRHWCDEHMVDIYKAMDHAYIRYMHDKYRGLTPDGH